MSDQFDPYHRWLGIPKKFRPPTCYQLLGLGEFEDDSEAIADAAERQMAHVRRYAVGSHAELSQRILRELAAARTCLLDPARRAAYDKMLRGSGDVFSSAPKHEAAPPIQAVVAKGAPAPKKAVEAPLPLPAPPP